LSDITVANKQIVNQTTRKGQLVNAGRAEDLPAGRRAVVEIPEGRELALFNVNGEFFATENSCPHRGAPLSEGMLCDHYIECALHGWQFDVRSGECLTVSERIETYPVRIVDGLITIEI
jgi:3-phenylpropionate/trans-cinnamate dioxygenase ferredoxin component